MRLMLCQQGNGFGVEIISPKTESTRNGIKGLVAGCHSFYLFWFFITYIHSFNHNTFIHRHSLKPLSISSSLVCSVGETSLWGRAENRTRACLTASRRAANWATPPHGMVLHTYYCITPQQWLSKRGNDFRVFSLCAPKWFLRYAVSEENHFFVDHVNAGIISAHSKST